MRRLLLILSLCSNLLAASLWAQDEAVPRPVTSVITMGIGQGAMRDTYLAPLLYRGTELSVRYERWRLMRQCRWNNQQSVDVRLSEGTNKSGLSDALTGRLTYRYAMHRVLGLGPVSAEGHPFSLSAGAYAGADLGFDYNLRMAGSNNPATARAAAHVGASAMAAWHYSLRRQPCVLSLQLQSPLLGMAFVPEYGASYFETFYLNHTDRDVHFTSLHNQQDLDVRLTTDVPVSVIPWFRGLDTTLRLGVACHVETMDINDIITRFSTCEFVIGWTYQYLPMSRRKSNLLKSAPAYAY